MPRDLSIGLTEVQKANRKSVLGGSDANIIMSGDDQRILNLWLEKTGQREPENLDDILPVIMGQFTEKLNVYWYEKQTGRQVFDEGKQLKSGFMGCTLDGLTTTQDGHPAIFEAKHVNAFSKIEDVVLRYMPQLHHNMMVSEHLHAVLSIFKGTQEWEIYEVSFDEKYAEILRENEIKFWDAVQKKEPPVILETAKIIITEFKDYDFSTNNEWVSLAVEYIETQEGAKKHESAKDRLKGIIPADAGSVAGGNVSAKRDKRGAIRFTVLEQPADR